MGTPSSPRAAYAIWERFPPHVRMEIVARRQAPGDLREDPLAAALWIVGREAWPRPRAVEVADALVPDGGHKQWRAVLEEALAFIDAWDSGRIPDLAAALGVAAPRPHAR